MHPIEKHKSSLVRATGTLNNIWKALVTEMGSQGESQMTYSDNW